MKKSHFKIEYLIYLFLLLTPFLDAISFLFRQHYPNAPFSPSTILRPIIPCILMLYIFIKDPKSRKIFLGGGMIYGIYVVLHLFVFQKYHTEFNAGGILSESQYLINYTYMIGLFYTLYWFYKQGKLHSIRKFIVWMLILYLSLIYLSIITKTSSPTYTDGVGYKGWNASGNGLSAVFILGICSIFTYLMEYIKKWYVWLFFVGLFYYLFMLFGTRTAFYGSILVILLYVCAHVFVYIMTSHKLKMRQLFMGGIIVCVVLSGVFLKGTQVRKRNANRKIAEQTIHDPLTNDISHLTGDLTQFVVDIKKKQLTLQLSDAQKKALLKTYKIVNEKNISNDNRRAQQLYYQHYLYIEEKSVETILFGTGYLNNYPELTLEMEVPAYFYNFGIIGMCLYLGPFLSIFIYMIISFFRHIRSASINMIMLLAGTGLSFVLSSITGYVFFSVPSMLVVLLLFILLIEENDRLCSNTEKHR